MRIGGSRYKLFFKERLGLKLTHKRITTKGVLPVSRVRVLYRGSYRYRLIVMLTAVFINAVYNVFE